MTPTATPLMDIAVVTETARYFFFDFRYRRAMKIW